MTSVKYSLICLALFVACELVGAWQDWPNLMLVGGGWLVVSLLILFTIPPKAK